MLAFLNLWMKFLRSGIYNNLEFTLISVTEFKPQRKYLGLHNQALTNTTKETITY